MTPSYQKSGGFVAVNSSHTSTAGSNFGQQELLKQVHPVVRTEYLSPSPPTKNTFQFPPLLECFSDNSSNLDMPRYSSNETDSDGIKHLNQASLCEDTTGSSSLVDNLTPSASRISEEEEINKEPLRDEYGSLDGTEITTYSLEAVIRAAKRHYGETRPAFCIKTPSQSHRTVRLLGIEETADLQFHKWTDELGYWVLTDENNDRHVVKCHGLKYFVWQGVEEGFAKEPAATVIQNKPRETQGSQMTDPNSLPKSDHISSSLISCLRERTARQNMPYTMYKTQKKFDDKGLRLTEEQLAGVLSGNEHCSTVDSRLKSKKRKQDDTYSLDSGFGEHDGSSSDRCSLAIASVSEEYMLSNTILRTRLHGFQMGSIPLVAIQYNNNESFFNAVKQKWAFKVGKRRIRYGVASFPWLDIEKNILMQDNDVDCFDCVMNEIRLAPAWQTEGRVDITIEFYVE